MEIVRKSAIGWALGLGMLLATLPQPARADPAEAPGPRLGALFGASFPHGDGEWEPNFAWGFFVDIPLASSFQISPSALVYTLDPEDDAQASVSATDVSLSFKFVLPVKPLEIFAGFTAGLTSAVDLDAHFGGQAGLGWRIARNFEAVTAVHYKVILEDRGNIQDLKAFVGPAFRF